MVVFDQRNRCPVNDNSVVAPVVKGSTKPFEEIQNACNMSVEFNALNRMLKRQVSGGMEEVNAAILNHIRLSNNDPQLLANWATEVLNNITLFNVQR